MNVISVENVSKKFVLAHTKPRNLADAARSVFSRANREDFWAVKDVSFDVKLGEAVGIIGHNGAGKSTMLKLLTRIMEPTSGRIRTRGRVSALIEVGAGFHPEMTGRENIYLNGSILGMGRREIDSKFDAIVAFAELEKFIDTPVKRYSSGMYARLGFAVAAHVDPQILIVDEVLAVGDLPFQRKCHAHMEKLTERGCSVVLVTHSMQVAKRICKRLQWLHNGSIRLSGDAADVEREYQKWASTVSTTSTGSGNRWGAGGVRILNTDVSVCKSQQGTGYDIDFSASIVADREVENAVLWAMVTSNDGVRIAGSTTRRETNLETTLKGKADVTCSLGDLPLHPGSYKINFGVFDCHLLPLDRWGECASFVIEDGDLQQAGLISHDFDGAVFAPSEWRISDG